MRTRKLIRKTDSSCRAAYVPFIFSTRYNTKKHKMPNYPMTGSLQETGW
jgi:hypothetical protein